ncbi:hypothetical protein CEXT_405481 [Caerostris extrusa]|uniref:Uncharacterized protein n=1 Tax=Caerostris extrusa TaxID=172846 RepID=A0AAV4NU98_CAEEX|nr:hypothetical protein CEXT_405481 [Caerostris extrusa]
MLIFCFKEAQPLRFNIACASCSLTIPNPNMANTTSILANHQQGGSASLAFQISVWKIDWSFFLCPECFDIDVCSPAYKKGQIGFPVVESSEFFEKLTFGLDGDCCV